MRRFPLPTPCRRCDREAATAPLSKRSRRGSSGRLSVAAAPRSDPRHLGGGTSSLSLLNGMPMLAREVSLRRSAQGREARQHPRNNDASRALGVVAVLALSLTLAACGGSDVAKRTTASTTTPVALWPQGPTKSEEAAFDDHFFGYTQALANADNNLAASGGTPAALPQAKTLTRTDWSCLIKVAETEPGETPYRWESDISQWGYQEQSSVSPDSAAANTEPAPPADISFAMDRCQLNQ